ncbi:hypothetical protein ACWD5F_36230 [Streptomyces sp. NPDC002499]
MIEGAPTERHPQELLVGVEPELAEDMAQFRKVYPKRQLELEYLYGAAQRAFEERTREALKITLDRLVRTVLNDPRLYDAPGDEDLGDYLDREIDGVWARLCQDEAVAVVRGLNIGLTIGGVCSFLLLCLPLLAGVKLLGLIDVSLNCNDRWSLLGAFVCGGVGSLGAVLSVLLRVRCSEEPLRRGKFTHKLAIAPAQVSRSLRHEGVYRVMVGWILALAVYFLLSTGWVTVIDMPATTAEICATGSEAASKGTAFWGFWCAIGFLAGFNERWAFGMLNRPETRGNRSRRRQASATESNDT